MLCPWDRRDRGAAGRVGCRAENGVDIFCPFTSKKLVSRSSELHAARAAVGQREVAVNAAAGAGRR